MIASEILGLGEQVFTFAILTNTATLFAILFIYRNDIGKLIINSIVYLKTKHNRYRSDSHFVIFIRYIASYISDTTSYMANCNCS